MNEQIYIDHQFDRLTQNAGPLALFGLAERLQNSVKNKLVVVNIVIYRFTAHHPDSRPGEFTLGSTFKSTVRLEEGAPLISALDQIPDGELKDAVITRCTYPTFVGNVDVTPDTPVKIEEITDWQGHFLPQNYAIYLQAGGDTEKATKNLGSVVVTVKFAIKYPDQDHPRIRHMDIHLKDGETLGNALDRASFKLELEEGSPLALTNTLVKNETAKFKSRAGLKTHVIVGQYYTIAVDVENFRWSRTTTTGSTLRTSSPATQGTEKA